LTIHSFSDNIYTVVINIYPYKTIKGGFMKEIYMSHHLSDTLAGHNRAIWVIGIITVAAAGTCIVLNIPAMIIIPVIAGAIMVNNRMIKRSICKVGLEGEERLRTYLRNILTDEYTALHNVPVEHGDIDCIIIGPKGLYAIEAKHHRGSITYTDNTWRQIKIGRKGGTYTGELKNPSGQLMQNIRWLRRYLSNRGITTWINGLIIFTHPEAELSIEGLKALRAVKLENLKEIFLEKSTLPLTIQQSAETHLIQLTAA